MGLDRWRPYKEFTAQSTALQAFYAMIGRLQRGELLENEHPTIVVFMAFSLEAYLNTLGDRQIPFWDEIERLPWRTKIKILHKVAGAEPNWAQGPLQFAIKIFKIRDILAHGKPERVCGAWEPGRPDNTQKNKTDALRSSHLAFLTKEWLLDAAEQFRKLMLYLGDMFGYHESDHLSVALGGFDYDDGVD